MYSKSSSTVKPEKVKIEYLPDETQRILLTDNAVEEQMPSDESGFIQTQWVYDEVVFKITDGSKKTKQEIENEFSKWWEYGKYWTEPVEVPLEQQVAALSSAMIELLGGMYGG